MDWLVPMNYNAGLFDARLGKITHTLGSRVTNKQLVMGINCASDAKEIRHQIEKGRSAGCRGFALFAYSHLFKNHHPTAKGGYWLLVIGYSAFIQNAVFQVLPRKLNNASGIPLLGGVGSSIAWKLAGASLHNE